MSKQEYRLAMDIDSDEIQLVKVVKILNSGLLETDGHPKDMTDQAIKCVIMHMAKRCEAKGLDNLTYSWVLVEKNKTHLGKFALKWFVKCDENE